MKFSIMNSSQTWNANAMLQKIHQRGSLILAFRSFSNLIFCNLIAESDKCCLYKLTDEIQKIALCKYKISNNILFIGCAGVVN